MKKIILGLLALVVCSFTFLACSDDDDVDRGTHSSTPETVAAGVYKGTLLKVANGKDDVTTEATMTLAVVNDSNGVARTYVVNMSLEDTQTNYGTGIANISWKGDDFAFSNKDSKNGFGTSFSGQVTSAGVATISFVKTIKEGRKTTNYTFTFTGQKQ